MKLTLSRDLAAYREVVRAEINNRMEKYRLQFITEGAAQAQVYAEKKAEIQRYDAENGTGRYPYAEIEAELYGISVPNAIQYLRYFQSQWEDLGPRTEAIRRAALVKVDMAKTVAEIDAALVWEWPL